MKMVKKFLVCLLFATPFLFVPKQSKAGIIGDIIHFIFGNDNGQGNNRNNRGNDTKKDPPVASNSVPLNGGLVILMAAGLGLGAKVIYDRKRSNGKQAVA